MDGGFRRAVNLRMQSHAKFLEKLQPFIFQMFCFLFYICLEGPLMALIAVLFVVHAERTLYLCIQDRSNRPSTVLRSF